MLLVFHKKKTNIDSLIKQLKVVKNDSLQAKLLINISRAYLVEGKINLALPYAERALSLAQQASNKRLEMQAENALGTLYYQIGDYTQATLHLTKLLSLAEETSNEGFKARSLQLLGKVEEVQRHYAKALQRYEQALQISIKRKDKRNEAFDYNNIGNAYGLMGKYAEALKYQEKSLALRLAQKDSLNAIFSYNDIAVIHGYLNKPLTALEYYQKACRIAESVQMKDFLAFGYANLAATYNTLQQYDLSLQYAQKALTIAQYIHSKQAMAEITAVLAQTYQSLKQYEKALYYKNLQMAYTDSLFNEKRLKEMANIETNYQIDKQKKQNELLQQQKAIADAQIQKQQLWIFIALLGLAFLVAITFVLYRNNQIRQKTNKALLEKNEEINQQNEEIRQIADSLSEANNQINKQKQDLIENITYAKRIQDAMLPLREEIAQYFPDHFILYAPKDIVSGDFYWYAHYQHLDFVAVADCTGHGVSGALMSMIGTEILNEIVLFSHITQPEKILYELHKKIRKSLKQQETKTNDGMDIAICVIDQQQQILHFAGAKNPLIAIQD